MKMESGDKSPTEQQSPFWESAQAPQSAASPQPEVQSVSPPQAQMVGNIGQQQSTHFSATVSNPAINSGNIGSASSITTGYDMSEKKKGMNWGQFAIGFFAPIVIMMLLTVSSDFTNDRWDERWDEVYRMEMITMSSDNGTFTHTFSEEVTNYGRFEVNWCNSMSWDEEYEYHCDWEYSSESSDKDIIEVKNYGRENEVVVGEYTQHNRTIWFSTDSHNGDVIEFEFEFYDRALEEELYNSDGGEGGGDMIDTFFCLMPLAGIVAIVISFAKGNKSLGYGLIASVSIPIVLGGLMLTLLLMFGF
jgi:hypothetical protein